MIWYVQKTSTFSPGVPLVGVEYSTTFMCAYCMLDTAVAVAVAGWFQGNVSERKKHGFPRQHRVYSMRACKTMDSNSKPTAGTRNQLRFHKQSGFAGMQSKMEPHKNGLPLHAVIEWLQKRLIVAVITEWGPLTKPVLSGQQSTHTHPRNRNIKMPPEHTTVCRLLPYHNKRARALQFNNATAVYNKKKKRGKDGNSYSTTKSGVSITKHEIEIPLPRDKHSHCL